MRPELKQFGDLRVGDFERVPVWAACTTFDYDEPWYGETDEETFRPWIGSVPVDPANGMFLVRARFELADGRTFLGFVTPAARGGDAGMGTEQPHLAIADRIFGFWGGLFGVAASEKQALFSALRSEPSTTFPIEFRCDAGLASGATSGTIAGFYRSPKLGQVVLD